MPKEEGYAKLSEAEDDSGPVDNAFAGKDLLASANPIQRLFWSWVRPLVDLGATRQINVRRTCAH